MSFFIVGLFAVIALVAIILAPSPVELRLSETSCLTSTCLVSQTVAFELKVKPTEKVRIVDINGNSLAMITGNVQTELPLDINESEEKNIPLQISLRADLDDKVDYAIDFGVTVESENVLWTLKNALWALFGLKNQATLHQTFKVRYPNIEFEVKLLPETSVLRVYDFQLLNREDTSYACKLRIVLSKDLEISDADMPLTGQEKDGVIYESAFEEIGPTLNSNCCNTVNINAIGGYQQIAQMRFSPVCKIDGKEVVIRPQEKNESWAHGANPLPA